MKKFVERCLLILEKAKVIRSLLCATAAFAQLRLLERASGLATSLNFVMRSAWARADWSGYRSRLLAPALIHAFGGDLRAFLIVTFIGLFIGGYLSWRLANGPGGLGIYHAVFALMANPWFSPWDIFEPVIFTAFVLLVVEEKSARWFIALFAVAIFNLQSAMFIALYMFISRKMVLEGVICAMLGLVVMYALQHSELPKFGLAGFGDDISTDYFRTTLYGNLFDIATGRAVGGGFDWLPPGILLSIIIAGVAVILEGYPALGVTFLIMLAATLTFALVTETRVFLGFIGLFTLAATPSARSSRQIPNVRDRQSVPAPA